MSKRQPNDAGAKTKFLECSKIVRRLAFEKAIASDVVERSLADMNLELDFISA